MSITATTGDLMCNHCVGFILIFIAGWVVCSSVTQSPAAAAAAVVVCPVRTFWELHTFISQSPYFTVFISEHLARTAPRSTPGCCGQSRYCSAVSPLLALVPAPGLSWPGPTQTGVANLSPSSPVPWFPGYWCCLGLEVTRDRRGRRW